MNSVSLEQIWDSPHEELIKLIESSGNESVNYEMDKVNTARIYDYYGMLNAEDSAIVKDTHFESVCANNTMSKCKEILKTNIGIVKHFQKLANYYDTIPGEEYRAKTFHNASVFFSTYEQKISSVQDIPKIRGMGASTIKEIEQYLNTGTSERLQKIEIGTLKEETQDLDVLMSIYGIGKVKAKELYEIGIKNVDDLVNHQDLLNDVQKKGLQWVYHMQERIPRDEVQMYESKLQEIFNPITDLWMITGSYRRGESTSGDIDIIVRHGNTPIQKFVQLLKDSGMLVETFALGLKKFIGLIQVSDSHIARQIDIRIFSQKEWPYGLLYNTGSKELNVLMRIRANELEMSLNEYGLTKNGKIVPAETEEDIFDALGISYIEPTKRSKDVNLTIL